MSVNIYSERLHLSEIKPNQTTFVFKLFNDPDCLRFIGDRGIRTMADAQAYLDDKLIASYRNNGYGLFQVSLKNSEEPLGICGLVKRDENNPPDIGFAFLPDYRGQGYCSEAGQGVLDWAKHNKVSERILAYTNPDNTASIKVLEKLGLSKKTVTTLPGQDFESLILSINLAEK